jgi:hypothetical protein
VQIELLENSPFLKVQKYPIMWPKRKRKKEMKKLILLIKSRTRGKNNHIKEQYMRLHIHDYCSIQIEDHLQKNIEEKGHFTTFL